MSCSDCPGLLCPIRVNTHLASYAPEACPCYLTESLTQMRFFKRFLGAKDLPPPRPAMPLAVIGDLHGRSDLLVELLERLATQHGRDWVLVFVGDYVDRGDNSAEVLQFLRVHLGAIWPAKVICLKGNHEMMLLDFLDTPESVGPSWLHHGGRHTLASFGVPQPDPGSEEALRVAADALRAVMGPEVEAWLRGLPSSYLSGNLLVTHAGANPHASPEDQTEADLLWGHPDFLEVERRDGLWVAHGHTIQPFPSAKAGRIAVDTGAYATHCLTAALLRDGACDFLSTRRPETV